MINPLSVASDGYLSVTSRVLVIAVAGYLNFGSTPTVVAGEKGGAVDQVAQTVYGGGGSQSSVQTQEEEQILAIINAFLRCQ